MFGTKSFLPCMCTAPMCCAKHNSPFFLLFFGYFHPSICLNWKPCKIKKKMTPKRFHAIGIKSKKAVPTAFFIAIPVLSSFEQPQHHFSTLLRTIFHRHNCHTFIPAHVVLSQLNHKLLEVRDIYLIYRSVLHIIF